MAIADLQTVPKMPEKRKSLRLAEKESAAPNKKVKYTYESDLDLESDISDNDSDSDLSDVDSIDTQVDLDPEEAARLAEMATKDAQAARAQIRILLPKLPKDEAKTVLAVLDEAESYEAPGARYSWAKLPAEVKNLIYHYTFVSDSPLKPHIWYPNLPERRRIQTYDLGGNFLRCSKEIYAQGRPILLGENRFEIGNQFRSALGADLNKKNSKAIRKVIVRCCKASSMVLRHLWRLENLEEFTLIASHVVYFAVTTNAEQSVEEQWARSFSSVNWRLRHAVQRKLARNIYYVTESSITSETKSDGVHKDNMVALRFQVENSTPAKVKEIEGSTKSWKADAFIIRLVARRQYFSCSKALYYGYPRI